MKKLLLIILILIAGCSWRSPNSRFYMMNSHGLSSLSNKKLNIAVAKIKVPDILNRPQMITYDTQNNQVNIMEFHRWAEVFPDVIQATVVNDLIAYLPNSYVLRTDLNQSTAHYNIDIEINTFQAGNDKVILSVWWTISDTAGKILERRQDTFETPVKNKSISALVETQSQTVHLLSRAIAEQLLSL